jgi:hypothetical protein
MKIITYSVDSATLNTATLFHKTWVVGYSVSGRQATGTVKGMFVCMERRYLFCWRFTKKKCIWIKIHMIFLCFQAFLLMYNVNV